MGKGARSNQANGWIPLVDRTKVASYRAHNVSLVHAYRADNDCSLTSALCRLHGQTVNIWSHGAGVFIFVLPHVVFAGHAHAPYLTLALRLHALVGCGCGLASAAFHICESWPTKTYSRLLALDYTMAYVATVSHACLIARYALRHRDPSYAVPPMLLLLGCGVRGTLFFLGAQAKRNTTDSSSRVGSVMGAPLLLVAPIVAHALVVPCGLTWVLLRWAAAFAVASGVWLLQLPECLFTPGTFDYFGNSHNLMHIGVLIVYRELHNGIDALVAADA